jgi:hypothetical protein
MRRPPLPTLREKIDAGFASLGKEVSELKQAFAKSSGEHAACYKIVMGNGKPSLEARVTALETTRSITKTFVAVSVSCAGVIASVVTLTLKLCGL